MIITIIIIMIIMAIIAIINIIIMVIIIAIITRKTLSSPEEKSPKLKSVVPAPELTTPTIKVHKTI